MRNSRRITDSPAQIGRALRRGHTDRCTLETDQSDRWYALRQVVQTQRIHGLRLPLGQERMPCLRSLFDGISQ
jgi:hypothetical protein